MNDSYAIARTTRLGALLNKAVPVVIGSFWSRSSHVSAKM
jgi:hypothetical protein